jgi:hypothetical protein
VVGWSRRSHTYLGPRDSKILDAVGVGDAGGGGGEEPGDAAMEVGQGEAGGGGPDREPCAIDPDGPLVVELLPPLVTISKTASLVPT